MMVSSHQQQQQQAPPVTKGNYTGVIQTDIPLQQQPQ